MVASSEPIQDARASVGAASSTSTATKPEAPYQEEICEKLIQLSFAKIVNSKSERGGARLHKNLLILHLLQKARWEQRNRLFLASTPMDTTSHVSDDTASMVAGEADDDDGQMQTDVDEDREGDDRIEIDETSGQQRGDEDGGTFSAACYYDRLTSSPCLSSSTTAASPESGFDGNYCDAKIQQRDDDFDFSIDVNETNVVEEPGLSSTTDARVKQELATANDGKKLRRPRRVSRHRRRSSSLNNRERGSSRSDSSSGSSSSSSDDSDESSSSVDEMDGGNKKSRDCLKRKFQECDTCSSTTQQQNRNPVCDWYSSPKMACLVHGNGSTGTEAATNSFQHQNLNGLISVLQSAALNSSSSDEQTSNDGQHPSDDSQLALAVRIYETDAGDGTSLTRSLSCPGLLELTCES